MFLDIYLHPDEPMARYDVEAALEERLPAGCEIVGGIGQAGANIDLEIPIEMPRRWWPTFSDLSVCAQTPSWLSRTPARRSGSASFPDRDTIGPKSSSCWVPVSFAPGNINKSQLSDHR
jgi:hypothetical protein